MHNTPFKFLLFLYFILLSSHSFGQGWELHLGGINDEQGFAIQTMPDGSFSVAGFNGTAEANAWLLRIDPEGKILTSRTYGTPTEAEFFCDLLTIDQVGFALFGYRNTFAETAKDFFLVRANEFGDTLWTKSYGGQGEEVGKSILATSNEGFALFGSTTIDNTSETRDFYLIATDDLGNERWTQSYGTTADEWGLKILPAPENGFFLLGNKINVTKDSVFTLLIRTDANGATLWEQTYFDFHFADAVQLVDNSLVFAGKNFPPTGNNDSQIALMKINGEGTVQWQKTFGGAADDVAEALAKTTDGGFVLTGYADSSVEDEGDVFLLKTDDTGDFQWQKSYGGQQFDVGLAIQSTQDNGFICTGITQSFGQGGDELILIKTDSSGGSLSNTITGKVTYDIAKNCEQNPIDLPLENWIVRAKGTKTFYANTDKNGRYNIRVDTGDYQLELIVPNAYWTACQSTFPLSFPQSNDSATIDFSVKANFDCPLLNVDIGTPFLRRCFENTYTVSWCNEGTEPAQNAYIEITFDSFLTVISSSFPWSEKIGNTYTFPIGNVAIGACGTFDIRTAVDCETTVLGQTHCVEAKIFPDSICLPLNQQWDGGSLELSAQCEEDSVQFRITNLGAPMVEPTQFIVVEDDVLLRQQNIQLTPFEEILVKEVANGSTYRLAANQPSFHPLQSVVSTAIEGCGTNEDGEFSLGFINQFSDDDDSPYVEKDCRENIGSFDPNDKQAFPTGVSESHCLPPNTELEYLLRFQNTGTDTAFRVVLRDTLSPFLDITSIQVLAGSHPYNLEIFGENLIKFTFDNILLPDSTTNEEASKGFVRFKVQQLANNPIGSQILNRAGIWFDFNEPIFTNQTFHEIGLPCYQELSTTATLTESTSIESLLLFPNPVGKRLFIQPSFKLKTIRNWTIYNALGQKILSKSIEEKDLPPKKQFQIPLMELPSGTYFLQLETDQEKQTAKFVKME